MRIIFIILIFPLALFGQDNNVGSLLDTDINVVFELTVNYVEPNFKLEISTKNDSINWNDAQLIKWHIMEPKNSLKTRLPLIRIFIVINFYDCYILLYK